MALILDLLTVAALLFGLFFMFIGALGILRLPDLFTRMHAASKCITLGISGMLLAAVFHFARVESAGGVRPDHPDAPEVVPGSTAVAALTKACLVILFQFVAAPAAIHLLARAAHMEGAARWKGILSDELQEDMQQHRNLPSH